MREKKTPLVLLRKFFGLKPGQSISGFAAELSDLSPTEKLEFAELCAEALGVAEEDRDFAKLTAEAAA